MTGGPARWMLFRMSIFMTRMGRLYLDMAGSIRCLSFTGLCLCMMRAGFLIFSAAEKRTLDAYGNTSACRGRKKLALRELQVKLEGQKGN